MKCWNRPIGGVTALPSLSQAEWGITPANRILMQFQGARHEGEMAEGLRGVAQLPRPLDGPFLAEQADVVPQREQALEEFGGLAGAGRPQQRIHQPEGAGQEDAFVPGQAVVAVLRPVAQHKAVFGQLPLDGVDGAHHAGIVRRQEPDAGDEQQAGIQFRAAVGLDEGVPLRRRSRGP